MSESMQAIFDAVRKSCSPGTWSRGVELTRAGAVVAEAATEPDELRFRITYRNGMISRHVALYPEDADWDCGCDSAEDACEHIAAAVIASRRTSEGQAGVRSAEEAGKIEYRFSREGGHLAFERWVVSGEKEVPLRATLAALASRRVDGPRFSASQLDLALERILGTHRLGPLARPLVEPLFRKLGAAEHVSFDGEPVKVDPDPVLPTIVLEDRADGFVLRCEDGEAVDESFANGVARCGGTLRPLGEPNWTAREREDLARGWRIATDGAAQLVTEILPSLQKRFPVDVRTDRLPKTTRGEVPRIRFAMDGDALRLEVLATLVYGDPPRARIDAGRLVHLDGPVPMRDLAAERRVVQRLRETLGLSIGVRETFHGGEAIAFRRKFQTAWKDRPAVLDSFRLAAPLDPSVSFRGDELDVRFQSDAWAEEADARVAGGRGQGGPGAADPGAVLAAWSRGESLVPLLDGGWAPLPVDWLERHGQRVLDLLAAREADGKISRAAGPQLVELAEELGEEPPPSLKALRDALLNRSDLPEVKLPDDLTVELRPYQTEGVRWLHFLGEHGFGALLADDMGLGKTVQGLCALTGRTLVVAPTSVLFNWQREAERFRPGLRVSLFHGAQRELDDGADVTLTTYALLRNDRERLSAIQWDTVILDEAQAIKNPDSKVAAAAFSLMAERRITLTGTPVENRLDELWSQFQFLNRGLLGSRDSFRERYSLPIQNGDAEAGARLRERVRPFVLRRLKTEVAPELPPRTDIVLRCELSAEEREIYESVHAATRAEVLERLRAGGGVMKALEALLRLRQAACHSGLLPAHEAENSSKVQLLMETLDSVIAEGHKALVFSQWTGLLDRTEPHLKAAGIEFLRLDGSTKDRGGVVEAFQSDDGPPLLLVSLRAGGTGLNLTAADHVFLLDLWWNPAVEDQAADRAHRLGQDRPVMVHRLVATDTVEEKILALQDSKRDLAAAALGESGGGGALSRDELLDLLA